MADKQSLSQEQSLAAYTFEAPVCILAGAGSGKTRVITHRIAHLVKDLGVQAWQILGVTFTNKAARELLERVQHLLPEQNSQVLLGTFHGLAAKFLRMHGDILGMERNFIIYDESESERLIKQIIKEKGEFTKDELNQRLNLVLKYKESNKTGVHVVKNQDFIEQVLFTYYERMKKIGALDFDGILLTFLELLKHDEGLMRVCSRIKHIVVDEYQDINLVQSQIVKLIAEHADTVAIVGDDDQSIYGWRGGSASFMQEFITYFPHTKLFRLEENYRSTTPILEAANHVISHNQERLGKTLRSIKGQGDLLRVARHFRDMHEALTVVEHALRCFEHYGTSLNVAVLMRTNAQSRPLEDALHRAKMPYRMVGGMRFYDRKEIKDVLAAARAILHEHSDVDLMRLIEALPLGIGDKTIAQMLSYAAKRKLSLFETMKEVKAYGDVMGVSRGKNKIEELAKLLDEVRKEVVTKNSSGERIVLRADEAIVYIISAFGFLKYYDQKDDDEAKNRLENIEQLVQAAALFVEDQENAHEPSDLHAFLETVALISKDETVKENGERKMGVVTLMTLHAAKGLEFDVVFLVGLEEGVLPHTRATQGNDEKKLKAALEEERRLMYVGMTRARKHLYLSYCQERFLHGRTISSIPSRFLMEIPEHTIDPKDRFVVKQFSLNKNVVASTSFKEPMPMPNKMDDPYFSQEEELILGGIKRGARVYHAIYRYGKVMSVSGSGKLRRAQVHFDDEETRVILVSHLDAA